MWKLNIAKDKIENWIYRLGDVEVFVREATCDQPWGPSDADYEKVRMMAFQPNQMPALMQSLWDRITNEKSSWRNVYKSLLIINYLVLNGPDILPTLIKGKAATLMQLKTRSYPDDTFKRESISIFTLAQKILKILSDDATISKERQKANSWRERKATGILNAISKIDLQDSNIQQFDSDKYIDERQNCNRHHKSEIEVLNNHQTSSFSNIPWTSSETLKEIDEKLEKIRINIPNYQNSSQHLATSANNKQVHLISEPQKNKTDIETPLIDFSVSQAKDTLFDDLDIFSNPNLTNTPQNQTNNLIHDRKAYFQEDIFGIQSQDSDFILQSNLFLTKNASYGKELYPNLSRPPTSKNINEAQFKGLEQYSHYNINTTQFSGNPYPSSFTDFSPMIKSKPTKQDSRGLDLDDLLAENISFLSNTLTKPKPESSPDTYFANSVYFIRICYQITIKL